MSDPLPGLKGRRILVTGDTGFKGSWLALLLEQAGAEVAGFALPAEPGSLSARLGRSRAPWSDGDVREPHAITDAFGQLQPEVVFHLAAQPLVRRSYREPVETFSTNVQGTAPPAGAATGTGATPSERIRVPATFIFTRPGRVEPPTVTVPPFVRVELTLTSRDGRAHALSLRAGGRTYRLRVGAGGRATTSIPGLTAGTYPLAAVGGGPSAKLIVGGRPGP